MGDTKTCFPNLSLCLGSKGAIQQFARALSRELGPHNITVNVPSPGFTDTDMIPDEYRAFGANLLPFNHIGTPKDGQTLPPF
jgi:3-oxoacyl-[acyl-carrier protein] reductase